MEVTVAVERKAMKYRPAIGSTEQARALRKQPTRAEMAMWRMLREGFPDARFRRQVPIRSYFADFASHRLRVAIEVDGGQHCDTRDIGRTRLIEAEGYSVLRFWNDDILGNPDGVFTAIEGAMRDCHPHPASPIKGEEK